MINIFFFFYHENRVREFICFADSQSEDLPALMVLPAGIYALRVCHWFFFFFKRGWRRFLQGEETTTYTSVHQHPFVQKHWFFYFIFFYFYCSFIEYNISTRFIKTCSLLLSNVKIINFIIAKLHLLIYFISHNVIYTL